MNTANKKEDQEPICQTYKVQALREEARKTYPSLRNVPRFCVGPAFDAVGYLGSIGLASMAIGLFLPLAVYGAFLLARPWSERFMPMACLAGTCAFIGGAAFGGTLVALLARTKIQQKERPVFRRTDKIDNATFAELPFPE